MNSNNIDEKSKKMKRAKIGILATAVVLCIIAGGVIYSQKFSKNEQNSVQAADSTTEVSKDTTSPRGLSDGTEDKESDTKLENPAYLEKYIQQQIKGQTPSAADGKKVAYLTFDDGPSETVTPQILDILKKEGVNATFFLIGKYVDKDDASKELVKREVAEGNAVGIHSYTHDYNYLFPGKKINDANCMSDFEKTDESIKNVLGQDYIIRALRFPGGQMSWAKNDPEGAEKVDKELHDKDWHQIDWNCESGDAEGGKKNADQLADQAIKTIGNREKAVILMHDTYGKEETAKSLTRIIEYLKQNGYEFKIMR